MRLLQLAFLGESDPKFPLGQQSVKKTQQKQATIKKFHLTQCKRIFMQSNQLAICTINIKWEQQGGPAYPDWISPISFKSSCLECFFPVNTQTTMVSHFHSNTRQANSCSVNKIDVSPYNYHHRCYYYYWAGWNKQTSKEKPTPSKIFSTKCYI